MGEKDRQTDNKTMENSFGENWLEEMGSPVDYETFKFVSQTYQAAAHLTMPVENPAARPVLEMEGAQYAFSDIPVNRGMLAAMKQLRELKAKNLQAYLCRLMHFGEILSARDKLGDLIKDGDSPDAIMVSEAVMYAAATANMAISDKHIGFDIEDVVRVAQGYAAAHPDED